MAEVSVVTPALNVEGTIADTVRSILASEQVAELVIVDDGSTDRTVPRIRAVADDRVRILSGPRTGISAALNTGLRAATHPYVVRCDGDDLIAEDSIAWRADFLDAHPDYVAISGGFATISPRGRHLADLSCSMEPGDVTGLLLDGTVLTHLGSWMIRRRALARIGGARSYFETGEDVDLQFRLAREGRVWHEPRVAFRYRLHKCSATHGEKHARSDFYGRAAVDFARQRKATGQDDLDRGHPPPVESGRAMSSRMLLTDQMAGHLIGQAWRDLAQGRRGAAIRRLGLAARYQPLSGRTWRNLAAICLKSLRAPMRPS